ncbi:MAG: hypothetical protein EPO09_16935 [Aquabacterium sp.]|uniref:BPSS1780 family membrane protein n=1 Tax=Aquabacterium sp. TaxID=1872578 RepID=UPI0011F67195|nr:BPSS1780 family membrane protein [Aquabacterium sp.]TAK90315.1 MAG: hypothetical protein EPO09_16935 [Aquabacterium sp.]
MKLKLVKASQGLVWIRQGMLACRQQPLGYIGLLGLSFMAATLLTALLGDVGVALATCLAPSIWMGFMLGTRRVLTGQMVTPTVMVEPFKTDPATRKSFMLLGAAYGLIMLAAVTVATMLGPDPALLDNIKDKSKDIGDMIGDPLVQQVLLLELVLTLPVTLMFLHAPALILWAHMPVAKAIFFSLMASWRNLGAFLVFGLGWFGVLSGVALLAAGVSAILPIPMLVSVVMMTASMWVAASFYASLYFTVVDCFEPHQPEVAPPSAV